MLSLQKCNKGKEMKNIVVLISFLSLLRLNSAIGKNRSSQTKKLDLKVKLKTKIKNRLRHKTSTRLKEQISTRLKEQIGSRLKEQISSRLEHRMKNRIKNRKNDQDDLKVQQQEEKRQKIYGQVSKNPKYLNAVLSKGITNNYKQMLRDSDQYFISEGLTTYNGSINMKDKIILNRRPNSNSKGLQYTYGELDEHPAEKQQYTANYDEMLTNPKLKYMAIGIHPELNSYNTRTLEPQMEDPIIMVDPDDQSQNEHKKIKRIITFLKMMAQDLQKGQDLTLKQNKILDNLKNYIQSMQNSQNDPKVDEAKGLLESVLKTKQQRFTKVVQKVSEQKKNVKQEVIQKTSVKDSGQIRFAKMDSKDQAKLETEIQKFDSQSNKVQVRQELKEKQQSQKQQNEQDDDEQSVLDSLDEQEQKLQKAVKLLQSVQDVEKQLQMTQSTQKSQYEIKQTRREVELQLDNIARDLLRTSQKDSKSDKKKKKIRKKK